jgi:hypothetical protein
MLELRRDDAAETGIPSSRAVSAFNVSGQGNACLGLTLEGTGTAIEQFTL